MLKKESALAKLKNINKKFKIFQNILIDIYTYFENMLQQKMQYATSTNAFSIDASCITYFYCAKF